MVVNDTTDIEILPAINGYHISSVIGVGALGTVFSAQSAQGETVAIKVMRREESTSRTALEQEFKALRALEHKHLVGVRDFGFLDDGRAYIVMDFVEGETLKQTLFERENDFDAHGLATVAMQISAALSYIHGQKFVHGDLKPGNIIVNRTSDAWHITLMDFGLSKTFDTQADGISGTFEYLAAELIHTRKASASSDLYALGCILYEMAAGSPPFTGNTPVEVLKMHVHETPDTDVLRNTIPIELQGIVATLLEKDPQRRYRSAFQLQEALAGFLGIEMETHAHERETTIHLPAIPRQLERVKALELLRKKDSTERVILISGPSGIGKSRLLREINTDWRLESANVVELDLAGASSEFEGILSWIGKVGVPDGDSQTQWFASIVAEVFPTAFPGVSPASSESLTDEGKRTKLLHACLSLALQTKVDAVFIDHLEEADALTREFLLVVLAHLQGNDPDRFFFVAAFDEEQLEKDFCEELFQGEAVRFDLKPLAPHETHSTLRSFIGENASQSFLNVVQKQSGGIPGRIEDILNVCIEERILERTRHGWVIHERENLSDVFPKSLAELFRRKLTKVTEAQARLLRCLAASVEPVSLELLAFVANADSAFVSDDVFTLEELGLVQSSPLHVEPLHPSLRVLLPDENSIAVHAKFLEWYDAHPEKASSNVLALHALGAGDAVRALPLLLSASTDKELRFDSIGAKDFLTQALPLSHSDEYLETRFTILERLIRLSNILGHREDQHEYLQELLVLAARLHDDAKLAGVYVQQGEYHLSATEYDRSRKSFERALELYRKVRDQRGEAECLRNLGVVQYRTNPGPAVVELYNKALQLYQSAQAIIESGNLLVDIGLLHYSVLENPEEALRHFDEARQLFEKENYERGLIRAYGNTGAQYFSLGKYAEALEYHSRAAEIARKIGERRMLATALGSMGQCESALCRFSPALLHLNEELRLSRELGNRMLEELCYENIGQISLTLGAYPQALDAFGRALRIAEATGNRVGKVACSIDLAGVHIERRAMDEAKSFLRKAEKDLAEVDDVNVETLLYYRFGMFFIVKSPQQSYPDALNAFRRMGDIADRQDSLSHRILARSYAGLCQLHLGRFGEALELSSDAIRLSDGETAVYGGIHDVFYNHALILRANKRASEAAEFFEKAYYALEANASSIEEPDLYRSYLEHVRVNVDIAREYRLIHRDDSRAAVAAIQEQNLRTLYEVSKKVNSTLDLPQLLDTIMDAALEAMNGERGMIFLIEDDQLALKVSRNVEKETIQDATEISQSIITDVIQGRQPIIVSDTSKDSAFKHRDSVVNYHIHSLICAPMRLKDRIIGTVYVDSRSDALRSMTFTEMDRDFLEAFSNLATMAIENARMHERLKKENLYLHQEVERRFRFENIIGNSKPMQKLFAETEAAITSESVVLIYGESGTGKELIARAIHYNGARKNGRFVAVDCGALPDTLLESELFGYKRGAFTGAYADKPGLFEEAHNGTLFLDEISNTSLAFQAKLLRVLQEGEFRRVGDTSTRTANVRIICATNRNLHEEIAAERFRQDLFYRLNVLPISIPALRERVNDVALLVDHFISRYNEKLRTSVNGVSKELIDFFKQFPWPGNVRELENLIQRMMVKCQDGMLTTKELPPDYFSGPSTETLSDSADVQISLRPPKRMMTMVEVEREHFQYVLQQTNGNKTEAAKLLGLKRTTFVERLKKLGMM